MTDDMQIRKVGVATSAREVQAQRESMAAAAAAPCPSGVSREHCGPCAASDALEAFDAQFMSAEAVAARVLQGMGKRGESRVVSVGLDGLRGALRNGVTTDGLLT